MADPIPDFKPGDPLKASVVNHILRTLRKALRVTTGPGLHAQNSSSGSHITLTFQAGARLALAGGSGIPARSGTTLGSATVTFQRISGTTISSTTETQTAYNYAPVAVGNNSYIVVRQVDGQWLVISEGCPA